MGLFLLPGEYPVEWWIRNDLVFGASPSTTIRRMGGERLGGRRSDSAVVWSVERTPHRRARPRAQPAVLSCSIFTHTERNALIHRDLPAPARDGFASTEMRRNSGDVGRPPSEQYGMRPNISVVHCFFSEYVLRIKSHEVRIKDIYLFIYLFIVNSYTKYLKKTKKNNITNKRKTKKHTYTHLTQLSTNLNNTLRQIAQLKLRSEIDNNWRLCNNLGHG